MSILPKPTPAPTPRTKDASKIALFYAIILVVFVVAQLFTFEDFLALVASFELPVSSMAAYVVAAFLVIVEVFAVPFLLRMPLSRAFRWVSMLSGWIVALLWIKLSLWIVLTTADVQTVGFLGTVVNVIPGWWAVFVSIGLGILAVWSAWGMWPKLRKK